MRVKVYRVDQEPAETEVSEHDIEQLRDLQRLVGGYVEQVHTQRLSIKSNVALVDEDGRLKQLKANYRATNDLGYAATLFGTVVVCGEARRGESMVWTDVND